MTLVHTSWHVREDHEVCGLVAHHLAATYEAEERGHLADLEVWPREEGAIADALWTADMTAGPPGKFLTYSV
jgi:hypothetical protein